MRYVVSFIADDGYLRTLVVRPLWPSGSSYLFASPEFEMMIALDKIRDWAPVEDDQSDPFPWGWWIDAAAGAAAPRGILGMVHWEPSRAGS
jgi:hypothetical protein